MSPDDPPSALGAILARHKGGDSAAANAAIIHCHDRLKALTRQMLAQYPGVGPWVETSDVFHGVVVKLLGALKELTFDTPADFLGLAACQVRRGLIDLTRKKRPELVTAAGSDPAATDPLDTRPDSTDDPYELAAWGELHAAIDALPADQRELFDLIYYQGLTVREAAAALGVPRTTLQARWVAARLGLMRRLGGEPPF
jgi:RNA polymerase sigma-70 factor (ECF subfamily)